MLYQVYGCKERTIHRVANQTTKRQVKNLTTVITKKQNVQIIVLVNMRMCVKLRSKMFGSCIGRDELILEILTCVEW